MVDKIIYIGHHVNTKRGFVSTADFATRNGANVYQIFLSSPKQYNGKRRTDSELTQLKIKLQEKKMEIIVHANYMLNFCNPIDSKITKMGIELLKADLYESVKLGQCIGVVIHMGKNVNRLNITETEAIKNYVKAIKYVLKNTPDDTTIIFETGAGHGTEVCTSIHSFGKLRNMFTNDEKKRIKFCLDTCHLYAAGYDLGNCSYLELFIDVIETCLGWKNIACVHLNDSKCKINSRKDRHADIGKGFIKLEGLKKFVNYCHKKNIPIILETPCEQNFSSAQQIELIKSWIK
jgi:deoxyribonuclease-4